MQIYTQCVFWIAKSYHTGQFTYNMVESACGDVGRDFSRQRETVMEDFEIALDELTRSVES